MAISTYAELQTTVGNWLHRSDLASIIPDLIRLGELRIFRDVRVRQMEEPLNVTISNGVAAIPADFVELKHAYINGTPIKPLEVRAADWLYRKFTTRSADSTPSVVAVEGANFVFGPFPDSAYTVKGTYYKRLPSLASSTNALFTANPDLYLFAALAEAAPYLKNDMRALVWETKLNNIIDQVNAEATKAESAGGALSMRVG